MGWGCACGQDYTFEVVPENSSRDDKASMVGKFTDSLTLISTTPSRTLSTFNQVEGGATWHILLPLSGFHMHTLISYNIL